MKFIRDNNNKPRFLEETQPSSVDEKPSLNDTTSINKTHHNSSERNHTRNHTNNQSNEDGMRTNDTSSNNHSNWNFSRNESMGNHTKNHSVGNHTKNHSTSDNVRNESWHFGPTTNFSSKHVAKEYYRNIQYYGTIKVGSNKQEFYAMFDPSSELLAIPSVKCSECRKYTKKFDSSKSDSYQNFQSRRKIESSGSVFSGYLSSDDLYLDSHSVVRNMNFLLYENETSSSQIVADGVLGLGVNYDNEKESLLLKLVHQGLIKKPVFSFFFTDSVKDTRIYFDDLSSNPNYAHIYRGMNYCSVTNRSSEFWECDLSAIRLRNKSVVSLNNTRKAVFETSTSYLVIPQYDHEIIKSHIQGNASCTMNRYNQVICKCKSPAQFQDFSLQVGNSSLLIPSAYLIDFEPYQEYPCRFQIIVDNTIDHWILGDVAMRGSYVTFDYQSKRVGFSREIYLSEKGNGQHDAEDAKIYYLIGLVLIGVAIFYLYRWANSQKVKVDERNNNLLRLVEN